MRALMCLRGTPVLDPHVVERTNDGGFVVASKGNMRANVGVGAGGATR